VYLTGGHLTGVHFILRVFLALRTRVARIPVSTLRIFPKLLIVGDLAVRLLGHPWSALRVVKKLPKRLLNGLGAARSQNSSSVSRTVPELTIETIYQTKEDGGRGGEKKRRQSRKKHRGHCGLGFLEGN
jgi:hypothetical protein